MKVLIKMLAYVKRLVSNISEPVVIVFRAVQKLLCGVLKTLVGAPAEAVDSISERAFQRAGQVDSSLDARAEAQKEQAFWKRLNAALERLYFTDNFLVRTRANRRWKNFWIVIIEIVSSITTFRGLNQVFSSLHVLVPLLLTLVIQTSLGYLASAASGPNSTPKQKGLLAVVLFTSVVFSYVGVTETILPYGTYAQRQYNEFTLVYQAAKDRGMLAMEPGEDPAAEISGQYMKIEQLLTDAANRYSDEVLNKAKEDLTAYEGMTIAVVVDRPDVVYRNADGQLITQGGGSIVQHEPDPEAAPLIKSAREKLSFIEGQRGKIEEIRALFQGEAAQATVIAAVESLTASDDLSTPSFVKACSAAQLLSEKCQELSEEMGSTITINLDLQETVQAYRNTSRLLAAEDIQTFQEIYDVWETEHPQPICTGIELLDNTLAAVTANNPSLLKEQLDQEVERAYGSLRSALEYVGTEEPAQSLTAAYQAYDLELPMLYAVSNLTPDSEHFGIALLAAAIALFNDGLAVLIGLWMEQRCMNWCSRRTIGINDLMPHLYPHFRAVIMPIMRLRIGWKFSFEDARDEFTRILEDYLSRFKLEPLLVCEGFTRCGKVPNNDPDFEKFCAFLLTWGLAKPIRPKDAKTLGLADMDDEGSQYILLSSRAEGWIIDLLGNAAELGYNEFAYSV